MNEAIQLHASGQNKWVLSGKLNFQTVPAAWARLLPLLSVPGTLALSLSGVKESNSAALALLLQGREKASETGCDLHYTDLPEDLLALARMSNSEHLLTG